METKLFTRQIYMTFAFGNIIDIVVSLISTILQYFEHLIENFEMFIFYLFGSISLTS